MVEASGAFGLVIGILIGVYIGIIVAESRESNLRTEAVERGYAEWVVDSGGNATWRWKEVQQ